MLCIGPSQILPSLLGRFFLITIIMKCIIRIVYGLFRPLDFFNLPKDVFGSFYFIGYRRPLSWCCEIRQPCYFCHPSDLAGQTLVFSKIPRVTKLKPGNRYWQGKLAGFAWYNSFHLGPTYSSLTLPSIVDGMYLLRIEKTNMFTTKTNFAK